MDKELLVNFHCHSIFSDGEYTPEVLVASLAAAGVRFAALTDHDTLEGLPRFQDALKKHGIGFFTGVEVTTQFHGREAHLVGYGFDPSHAELVSTLLSVRQARNLEVHSIADSLRKAGSRSVEVESTPHASAAPDGQLGIGEAIALIHRAGGRVFWAHPLTYSSDMKQLDGLVGELKEQGLDGIEAIYAPFTQAEQKALCDLAEKHGLLVCAGTDIHGAALNHSSAIPMPRADWIKFRAAVLSGPAFTTRSMADAKSASSNPGTRVHASGRSHPFRRRSFVLRIFLPTFIAIALLLAAFWLIILPSFEQTLLDRKREMIRELTNSAWSILASYERDETSGRLTREQAQNLAVERIEALRYGAEGKDYFWIQDLQPRMIMHPYRADLNGQDLSDFKDPRGVPIFVEFSALVEREGEGYIDYVWQWKDEPERLEPKESYVKGFEPWGWIIGTGVYIDDVNQEIARIEQSIINTSLAISGAIIILLVFVLQQSLRIERQRQEVVDNLRESTERYHTLVEATTEGTLLVLDDRCRYANPIFLSMVGYTAAKLEFLDLEDLLPHEPDNEVLWARIQSVTGADEFPSVEGLEGCLCHQDGSLIECVLALNPIQYAGQRGFILLARDIAHRAAQSESEGLLPALQSVPLGIFRARAARRGAILEMNNIGRSLLQHNPIGQGENPALADFFADFSEYEQVFQILITEGQIQKYVLNIPSRDGAALYLALSASVAYDEQHHPIYIDGILEDVSVARRNEVGREALIAKLQASLLFLHEPVANLGREVLVCDFETTIEQASRMMTARDLTAALVASETSTVIGIVTDHDLRARVLAEKIDRNAPLHRVMSAPIIKVSEEASIYEALMRMEEKGVRHLAVEDRDGQIVSVIDSKSLIQFQRYGPIVLSREIMRAGSPGEVALCSERTAPLARSLLDSSARPRHVTNMLASICDATTERLIQLAIEDLGPPPAPFAFIAMGSQGRQEQTLLTDQDNGILYAPAEHAEPQVVNEYFLRLGARVCEGLDRAGYQMCRGNVMASNPRWCRSLPDWLTGFDEWVQHSEPQELIDLSIFFDFRTVYGEAELAHELHRHIHTVVQEQPTFFHHFAQNALVFRLPFRLLGNIYLSGGTTEHSGEINLKDAMMPMVSFARLYALRHQINQTHTLQRIETLAERNIISASSRDEISAAYDFLMQLRLQNQLAAIQAGRPPQNTIHPGKLGYIQQELLKQAFAQIAAVQKKVSYDFLGGI